MIAAQHTPGPWLITLDPSSPAEYSIDAMIDGTMFHIALVHPVGTDEEFLANATLIHAAPDMLAKLREIAGECGECAGGVLAFDAPLHARVAGDPCPACEDIRELIAKAEGRS